VSVKTEVNKNSNV